MTRSLDMAGTIGLAKWWWTLVVRGVVAIVFGLLAFQVPAFGLAVLVALFGVWALIDGAGSLLAGIRTRGRDRSWWIEVVEGVVSIAAGALALLLPTFAAEVLVLLIAVWSIVTGVIEIGLAIRLRRVLEGEVWLALAGVASVLFGGLILLFPAAGARSIVWLIGSFAIAFGAFLIMLGWRLRTVDRLARIDAEHDYGSTT